MPAGQASGAGILPAVGVCDGGDQVRCDYMACLADNFKNSQHANSIKQGSQVMMDPELRSAITNDPQISKIACDKAQLDATGKIELIFTSDGDRLNNKLFKDVTDSFNCWV